MLRLLPRDLIARCARNYADKVAYFCGEGARTWRQMHQQSDRLAGALQALGIRKGHAVGIFGYESFVVYEHVYACMKAGAVRVSINWRSPPAQILHVLRDSRIRVLLVQSACLGSLEAIREEISELGITLVGYGGEHDLAFDYASLLAKAENPQPPSIEENDPLLYIYTSGTTGNPKGVVLTHGSVVNTIFQSLVARGLHTDDVWYQAGQSCWMSVIMLLYGLGNGMSHVLPDGVFDVKKFLSDVERRRVTVGSLVPTNLQRVIDECRRGTYDVSSLREVGYGSAPATPKLIREAYEVLGCDLLQAYGMTEAGWVTHLTAADHRYALAHEPELLRSAGRVGMSYELSIRDEEGNTLEPGGKGVVWIRGNSLMKEYLNLPEQTAETLRDGWLCSNDIGSVDDRGYLYLLDRKKHMIISGAINVFPSGVEAVLAEHPSVYEAAVVGVPHPEWGEAVVAVIQAHSGVSAPSALELIAFCERRLSKPECPKHVLFVEELPKAATGKTNKMLLRQQLCADPGLVPWKMQ